MAIEEKTIIRNLEKVKSIENGSVEPSCFDWKLEDRILNPANSRKLGLLLGSDDLDFLLCFKIRLFVTLLFSMAYFISFFRLFYGFVWEDGDVTIFFVFFDDKFSCWVVDVELFGCRLDWHALFQNILNQLFSCLR